MDNTNEKSKEEEKVTPAWQTRKESWYDQLNVTVKQLDIIIGVATAALILVFILIGLDAANII